MSPAISDIICCFIDFITKEVNNIFCYKEGIESVGDSNKEFQFLPIDQDNVHTKNIKIVQEMVISL